MVLPAKQALQSINKRIMAENRDFQIVYLDAGFPLFDRFPLIPHLSHGDRRKVDLALVHQNGKAAPSPIGYWSYVQPRPGDPKPCEGREGWLRWDFEWLQPEIGDSPLDEEKTPWPVTDPVERAAGAADPDRTPFEASPWPRPPENPVPGMSRSAPRRSHSCGILKATRGLISAAYKNGPDVSGPFRYFR